MPGFMLRHLYQFSNIYFQPNVPLTTFSNLLEASGNVPVFEKGKEPPLAVTDPLFLITLPDYITLLYMTIHDKI